MTGQSGTGVPRPAEPHNMSDSLPSMSLYKEDGSEVKLSFDSPKKARVQSAPASKHGRVKLVATERQYSKETLASAYKLFDDNALLEEKLAEPNFHEAMLYCGVLVENLPKRPFEFFTKLPQRVRKLNDFHAKLRMEEYDKNRMDMLRQICEREQECIEYQRKRQEKEKRYFEGLQQTYKLEKEREQKRKNRSLRNRENLARAVQMENERLLKKRSKGAQSQDHYAATLKRIGDEKAKMIQELKLKGKARDNHIRKQVEAARRKKAKKAEETTIKFEEKYAKIERMLEMQRESSQGHRSEAMRLKAQREEQMQKMVQEKHERLLRQMKERDAQVRAVQIRKAEIIEQEKIMRQIKNQSRREKAEQTRRAKLYARKRYEDHLESVDARIKAVEKMREAVQLERHTHKREELIERHRWQNSLNLERSITPGPGEYLLPDSSTLITGGTWGKFKPKTDIDVMMDRAKDLPGPGNYAVPDTLNKNGGSWSFYSPKSEIEELQHRAKDLPGPGEYELKGVASGVGGGVQFSDANPKSDLERYIYENKDTPGPGAYSKGLPEKRANFKDLDKRFGPGAKVALIAAKLKNKLQRKLNKKKLQKAKQADGSEEEIEEE